MDLAIAEHVLFLFEKHCPDGIFGVHNRWLRTILSLGLRKVEDDVRQHRRAIPWNSCSEREDSNREIRSCADVG